MKNEKFMILPIYVCLLLLLTPPLIFADSEKKSNNYTISGLIGESQKSGDTEYGPIQLRQKYEDWNKPLNTVSGAFISYTNDRIEDTGTWQTQGSLIYPIQNSTDLSKLTLLPSIQWNYLNLSSSGTTDIEELIFRLPVSYFVEHDTSSLEDIVWYGDFYFSPFYLTDFDFEGSMVGVQFTYEPKIQIDNFQIGWWHGLLKDKDIAYLLRIIPGVTYGRVLSESPFIDHQEHDNLFAITASLELRFKLFGEDSPWEIYGTYDLLYDFSGDSNGYADNWNAGASWWITKNVGLNLGYEKGDTVLTNKEIDLVTLNLQLRL